MVFELPCYLLVEGLPSTTERSDTQQSHVCDEATDSEEPSRGSGSGLLLIICRNIHEQLGKVSRRIVVVEQQHKQISLAVKELSSLTFSWAKASGGVRSAIHVVSCS